MKAEQLKRKVMKVSKDRSMTATKDFRWYWEDDIKLAVNFLIDRVENYTLIKNKNLRELVLKDIKETFEDITKGVE